MLFEIFGQMFLTDRNPYIYNDYLENPKKIKRLKKNFERRLNEVNILSEGNPQTSYLIENTRRRIREYIEDFYNEKKKRRKVLNILKNSTAEKNIQFGAFHKIAHSTDASDWRVENPFVVVYPDTEKEIPAIVRGAQKAGLTLIPRGAGTGLTGGAVPVRRNSMVLNLEKLNRIHHIKEVNLSDKKIPVISLESGVVTEEAMDYAKRHGYIFATDPTSSWASTIGGNIAENSGGKKCVMWGTAIDNIYSFDLIDASGSLLRIRRINHPYRKIEPEDQVLFSVNEIDPFNPDKENEINRIEIPGTQIRKRGLGKDITNKALNGIPGIQKEGGDGIITKAEFVLYTPFKYAATICLEFFGKDMDLASRAIVDVISLFKKTEKASLTALEHFDDKYIEAIAYKKKTERKETPKAVLLIDIESNEKKILKEYASKIPDLVQKYNTDAFVAEDENLREHFWKDRKNLSAIARHTNAFKLNEDVVIPIEKLPEFADYIEKLNYAHEIKNSQEVVKTAYTTINELSLNDYADGENDEKDLAGRKMRFERNLKTLEKKYRFLATNFSKKSINLPDYIPLNFGIKPKIKNPGIFHLIRENTLSINSPKEIKTFMTELFSGYRPLIEKLNASIEKASQRKIVIATHMHAGDGNIHVNIPVHSNDYRMMKDAEKTAARVMKKTVDFGGVISGEHGIGLTKLRYIDRKILRDFKEYKTKYDSNDFFNPDKLSTNFNFDRIYTPSFNLLEKEAFILKSIDLENLSNKISSCLRCSRCKSVCNTFFPDETMFYHPRNKILSVATIIEAVLYNIQTSNSLDLRNFAKLMEISNHCTLCHRCEKPCPVDIDFAEVTLDIRKLLVERKMYKSKPATRFTLYYLKKRNYYFVKLFRHLLLKGGYAMQRAAFTINRPIKNLSEKIFPTAGAMLKSRLPKAGNPSLREIFSLKDKNSIISFSHPKKETIQSVFYFPGCGSERMFSDISMATIALLYFAGYRIVIPQEYLCCGYPLLANGKEKEAEIKVSENRMIFHKISESVSYMNIEKIIVSCGTCHEMLKKQYRLDAIFPNAELTDINEFLVSEGIYQSPRKIEEPMIYHDPCHTPLKKYGHEKVFNHLYSVQPHTTEFCCGEGGTLALSTPKISNSLRKRKTISVNELSLSSSKKPKEYIPGINEKVEVLTTCPSCVQGLSRYQGIIHMQGKSLAVKNAEIFLGKKWKKKLIKELKPGIDKIML